MYSCRDSSVDIVSRLEHLRVVVRFPTVASPACCSISTGFFSRGKATWKKNLSNTTFYTTYHAWTALGSNPAALGQSSGDKPPDPWHGHQNCLVQPSFPILFEDNKLNWMRLIAETRWFASWLGLTYFPPFAQHFTNSCWWMADLHLRPSGHLLMPRPPSPPSFSNTAHR